jgi:crossover junction endodeoxyribonuclease RuvC
MKPIKEKIIMGIDPGTNVMGYGIIKVTGNKAEMIAMGIIDLRKEGDMYLRLGKIFQRVTGIIDSFLPDEVAIESPFFGKNVQSMLKLGRAQGVAMAAAINHSIPITEYAPLKIKMAITGNGSSSKEQVAYMLQNLLNINKEDMPKFLDATDALGAAYCHFIQICNHIHESTNSTGTKLKTGRKSSSKSWEDFVNNNPDRVSK